MKKILFFLLATFLCHFGYSQYVYTTNADTVKFTNAANNTELIIENSTKNVPGFLYNKGNGKTEFRKILVPVSSNKYLLGSDTLDLSGTGTGGAWGTAGTAGTTAGTSFIGTTDNVPINFRVNNVLAGTIGTTANYNVSLGLLSLPNTSTGIKNMALGGAALGHNTTGQGNNAIGYTTLANNTTGNYNTANGWGSSGYNQAGSGNTTMGAGSMNTSTGAQTFGSYNTALGFDALTDLFTGNYNIGLGAWAGSQRTGRSNTLYVSDSTYHMYYKLDSVAGIAPSVVGKDSSGFWHIYKAPTGAAQIAINSQTANYTLQLSDAGNMIAQTVSATSTVTVPPNLAVAFPVGSKIMINQKGSGQVSIAKGSGVTINSPDGALRLRVQYATATLIKTDTDEWVLSGDISNTVNTFDLDAQKFIDSSGITDSLTKLAVNNLVLQLKDSSLWSNFTAIYPMVGGTANSTSRNLKDPRNLDAAYRLTFSGTPTYASTGVLFPTTSDYANTHLADNALSAYNNNSISYYSRTQNSVWGYDMGCADNATYYNEFTIYHGADATFWFGFGTNTTPANTKGLFMLSSTSADAKRYENGVVTNSKGSAPSAGFTNLPILIGKVQAAATGGKRECALASIGQGLTDAQAATFYRIIQNFQSALGRSVN